VSNQDVMDGLKQDLEMDINALHEEAKKQSSKVCDAGELFADLKADAKNAKMNYDKCCAEVEMAYRTEAPGFEIECKVTEAVIKAAVSNHPKVVENRVLIIECEKAADKASALVDGFHHKKSMIDIETRLYTSNYWGDTYVGVAGSSINDEPKDVAKPSARRRPDSDQIEVK